MKKTEKSKSLWRQPDARRTSCDVLLGISCPSRRPVPLVALFVALLVTLLAVSPHALLVASLVVLSSHRSASLCTQQVQPTVAVICSATVTIFFMRWIADNRLPCAWSMPSAAAALVSLLPHGRRSTTLIDGSISTLHLSTQCIISQCQPTSSLSLHDLSPHLE
jgi:hypothetical protein